MIHVSGMGELKHPYTIWLVNLKGRNHLENLSANGILTLKYFLKEYIEDV
jgi:hypothetical protein